MHLNIHKNIISASFALSNLGVKYSFYLKKPTVVRLRIQISHNLQAEQIFYPTFLVGTFNNIICKTQNKRSILFSLTLHHIFESKEKTGPVNSKYTTYQFMEVRESTRFYIIDKSWIFENLPTARCLNLYLGTQHWKLWTRSGIYTFFFSLFFLNCRIFILVWKWNRKRCLKLIFNFYF